MMKNREFNTSDPNNPTKHYTLMREELIEKGKNLVYREKYFTIWAPRQTGKSTYFRLLAKELEKEGYEVAHVNFENYADAPLSAFYPYTNGEQKRIQRRLLVDDFLTEDHILNFDKLISNYKAYVQRRSFKYFREKDKQGNYVSIKEAALVYSFETYIQAFLQEAEGKSYLEAHTGLGRTDLLINLHGKEYIIEFKIYYSANQFTKGKKQLAYYCNKNNLTKGYYLVFFANDIPLPKTVKEQTETINGIEITTYLVIYDEEKDF